MNRDGRKSISGLAWMVNAAPIRQPRGISPDDLGPKEKSFQFPIGIPNPPPL
jgi:hypothetical protein